MKKIMGMLVAMGSPKARKGNGDYQQVLEKLPVDSIDGLKHVFDNVTDYLRVAEQEKTNRAKIESNKMQALEAIRSQRELITLLINRTFDERGQVLAKQFEALDHALANGNIEIVQASLTGMVTVIQTSPFKTVQEMQQALGAKDFVIRLE